MTAVFLAEDNGLLRAGLELVLQTSDEMSIVGVASSLDELLDGVARTPTDVVITDIRMPPTGTDEGIRAARELRTSHPGIGVVVLSQYDHAEYAISLMEHGSHQRAYVLKEHADPDSLFAAVRAVAAGGTYVDRQVIDKLVGGPRRQQGVLGPLTAREREILAQLGTGKSNAGIAATLFIGERAVEKHINSIFAKLGLVEDPDTNRRVMAVLLYLSESSGG